MSLDIWSVRPRQEKHNLFTIGSKLEPFIQHLTKFTFFYQHSQPLYDVMQKEIENLELDQGLNFEVGDSLKSSDTKYLLIFDASCEEICDSNSFADIATVGRHDRLSTFYVKHNLFHQSKLVPDNECQSTHIVPFSSPCDVMQVSTVCTVGSRIIASWLVSERNICTLLSFVDWLVASTRRLITLLCKHRIHSLKAFYPRPAETIETFGRWKHKTSLLSSLQSFSHKCKSLFLQSCPKELIRFLCEFRVNFLRGNLQSIKFIT